MIENHKEINTEQHSGPHIPTIQGELVYGPISNTTIASLLFLFLTLIFGIIARKALSNPASKIREAILGLLKMLYEDLDESFHDKNFSRSYLFLIGGLFFIILFGNLFGLIIDWAGMSISQNILYYFRPINSDLNTTLGLALITVVSFLYISFKYVGAKNTFKGYFFNFTGSSMIEKPINVFVGWLHLLSIPSTLASLSLRLFGNIFAGVILVGIITYLGSLASASFFGIGRLLSIPFWFFELFVSLIQAIVFMGLTVSYFKQSKVHH